MVIMIEGQPFSPAAYKTPMVMGRIFPLLAGYIQSNFNEIVLMFLA